MPRYTKMCKKPFIRIRVSPLHEKEYTSDRIQRPRFNETGGFTMNTAVLFARPDSIYKRLPGTDVYDIDRDARTYPGGFPVIAHPPCRAWGRLRTFANPRPDEKDLARAAVRMVRENGGVLEHPAFSTLWDDQNLPLPGFGVDEFGGWTFAVSQHWFGHRAEKMTWLYVCGISPYQLPRYDLHLGESSHVVAPSKGRTDRPSITKPEREATPEAFATWLLEVCHQIRVIRGVVGVAA